MAGGRDDSVGVVGKKWWESMGGSEEEGGVEEVKVIGVEIEGKRVDKLKVLEVLNGGYVGEVRMVQLYDDDGEESGKYVWKRISAAGLSMSKVYGLYREAAFYAEAVDEVRKSGVGVAHCLSAYGDGGSGEKELLVEFFGKKWIQCGYLFGEGSPLNKGKDLAAECAKVPLLDAERVTSNAFTHLARFHSTPIKPEWRRWLRGAMWGEGVGREGWEKAYEEVVRMFESGKGEREWWSKEVLEVVEDVVVNTTWEKSKRRMEEEGVGLAHGDFHPGNCLCGGESGAAVVFVDWEMVGVGSAMQDLAQWMISHVKTEQRREMEERLLLAYCTARGWNLEEEVEKAKVWYGKGGIGRWVVLLLVMEQFVKGKDLQWFHDQLHGFIQDWWKKCGAEVDARL